MKRGVSPVVAVVLLIAIAVVAAVGLYYWVTAFTTPSGSPAIPEIIIASCIGAGEASNGTLFISNSGTKTVNVVNVKVGGAFKSFPNASIPVGGTYDINAGQIGDTITLYTGTTGIAWAPGGSAVSFHCKEA